MARRITLKTKSRTWWGQHQSSICSSALPTDIDYLRKFGASTSTHSASHHILKYVPGELAADGSEDLSRLSADRRSPCRHWEARRQLTSSTAPASFPSAKIEVARAGISERSYGARQTIFVRGDQFDYWTGVVSGLTGRQDHDLYRHGRRRLVWRRHDAEK